MYRQDWLEQLKLGQYRWPGLSQLRSVSPVVWALGLTSCLTDISTEMVNSILPVYIVLHLRMSPLQYGAIDGIYNGLSVILISLVAGLVADRWRRHKEVAIAGYSLSAVCKLFLVAAGGIWGWIMAVIALDRIGKGIRTAPRDAMISFYSPARVYATAFGVHRMLDAAGALIGPIVAFVLLARIPGDFNVLWLLSFLIGLLGVAALVLFVPARSPVARTESNASQSAVHKTGPVTRSFWLICVCGALLAMATVSDGFLYLLLQQKGQFNPSYVPLFYVGTATSYMLLALPMGMVADRVGRGRMFLGGYFLLAGIYGFVVWLPSVPVGGLFVALLGLGAYYAATEGVLLAMASAMIPAGRRTTYLALLGTSIGLGKLVSSLVFGWVWQTVGPMRSLQGFAFALVVAWLISLTLLHARNALD